MGIGGVILGVALAVKSSWDREKTYIELAKNL
jgi:hypothetical protein